MEELNVSRAAARLNISQPPLTRQLHQLEGLCGTELLRRTPKGVEPTSAGLAFYAEARNILSLVERSLTQARLAGDGQIGQLSIGVFGSIVLALPTLISAFRKRSPKVEITLHTLNKTEQVAALLDRRISVGLSLLGVSGPGLVSIPVRQVPMVVAINETDELAKKKSISFRQLSERPLLIYTSGPRPNLTDIVLELFRGAGLQANIAQEIVDSLVPAVALVAAGIGVCIVPKWVEALHLSGVTYRPLRKSPSPTIELHCAYRVDDRTPIVQKFVDTLFGKV